MDFTFDVKQIPLIGKQIPMKSDTDKYEENAYQQSDILALQASASNTGNSPRRSSSLSPADNAAIGWKRPWMSQVSIFSPHYEKNFENNNR